MVESSGHTSPLSNVARNPKNISPPAHCRTCAGQFSIFEMKGHPDDGEVFACGVMLENMKVNGSRPFACSYRAAPEIAPIIDAEEFTTVTRNGDRVICKHPDHTCQCSTENPCGKTIAAIIDAEAEQWRQGR